MVKSQECSGMLLMCSFQICHFQPDQTNPSTSKTGVTQMIIFDLGGEGGGLDPLKIDHAQRVAWSITGGGGGHPNDHLWSRGGGGGGLDPLKIDHEIYEQPLTVSPSALLAVSQWNIRGRQSLSFAQKSAIFAKCRTLRTSSRQRKISTSKSQGCFWSVLACWFKELLNFLRLNLKKWKIFN